MPRGVIASDAIIFNGDATIAGDVTNNVVAFNGDVLVTGHVGENVVAINGRVTLGPGARVGGDVVSSDTPDISPTATVGGRVRPARSFDVNFGQFTVVSRILVWLATSISSFLLGLLLVLFVPRAMDATARTGIDRLGASIGFGFLMLIGVPLAAFVAIGIIVGIPLGSVCSWRSASSIGSATPRAPTRWGDGWSRRRPIGCWRSWPAGGSCASWR